MAQPSPYDRAYNFSNWQAQNPTAPLPANALDEELSRVKAVLDQIRSVIKAIQRDDTALANRSVGFDQLKTEIEIGVNPPGPWESLHSYIARDTVFSNSAFYICLVSHVSGNFATDLANGKWSLIASFEAATSANSVTYNDSDTSLGATIVQTAIEKLAAEDVALAAALAALTGANIEFDPTGLKYLSSTNVQDALSQMDSALGLWGVPVGVPLPFAGATPPSGYLLCNGQLVSRTEYARLFGVIGTAWGAGDGSTTFAVPDLCGRTWAGLDNMGVADKGRLSTFFGSVATTLGGVLGAASHVLTVGQLAKHTPTFTGNPLAPHDHTVPADFVGSGTSSTGGYVGTGSGSVSTTAKSAGTPSGTISQIGNDEAHPNAQPTAMGNWIIRT